MLCTALQVSEYSYGSVKVRVQEQSLSEGLGAMLWTVSHILSRELAGNRDIVAGKRVLEIGSGCGLCGIVAAKLGAAQVRRIDRLPNQLPALFQGCLPQRSNVQTH